MNRAEALQFLQQHQPLPPDDALTEEQIASYREVLNYCRVSHDSDCISKVEALLRDCLRQEIDSYMRELVQDILDSRQKPDFGATVRRLRKEEDWPITA